MSVAVLLLVAILAFGGRRSLAAAVGEPLARRRARQAQRGDDRLLLADLTAIGLSAGLTFSGALTAAVDHVSEETARTVRRGLRSGDRNRVEGAAKELFALADRALVTGAPLLASIDGYAHSLRRDERAAAVERARRLPVKLLFPLALLILPGFLLLTVAPAFLAGIDRLGL
jgi:tight adherence protein C